jgi:hypothetical protein
MMGCQMDWGKDKLEQRCDRPGNWYIEGYRVQRRGGKWRVSGVTSSFPSLSAVREWIVDELNGEHRI